MHGSLSWPDAWSAVGARGGGPLYRHVPDAGGYERGGLAMLGVPGPDWFHHPPMDHQGPMPYQSLTKRYVYQLSDAYVANV